MERRGPPLAAIRRLATQVELRSGSRQDVEEWTSRLTGLSAERIGEVRERLDGLGIEHLSAELCRRADIDAVAGACMLASAIDALVNRGVQESKLVGKLRGDRDIWPTVAELIAGRLLLPLFEPDLGLRMDSGPVSSGPNADFRLTSGDSNRGTSIEFKALGLSSVEAEFFREAAAVLQDVVPGSGVTTYHVPFGRGDLIPTFDPVEHGRIDAENRQRQRNLPRHIRDLRGAVVAADTPVGAYIGRVRHRVEAALRQLDPGDECWVAFWWSNAAPLLALRDVLSDLRLPDHVLGLMVVGAGVVVPDPRIHYFHARLPRPELSYGESELPVVSLENDPSAAPILEAFERSSGIRPALLIEPDAEAGGSAPLLFRDGSRRIFPFNLLVGPDPAPR